MSRRKKITILCFFIICAIGYAADDWALDTARLINEVYIAFPTEILQNAIIKKEGVLPQFGNDLRNALMPIAIGLWSLFFFVALIEQTSEGRMNVSALARLIMMGIFGVYVTKNAGIIMTGIDIYINKVLAKLQSPELFSSNNIDNIFQNVDNEYMKIFLVVMLFLISLIVVIAITGMIIGLLTRAAKLLAYSAISPIFLSSFASTITMGMGIKFIQGYITTAFEIIFIFIAIEVFSKAPENFGMNTSDGFTKLLAILISALGGCVATFLVREMGNKIAATVKGYIFGKEDNESVNDESEDEKNKENLKKPMKQENSEYDGIEEIPQNTESVKEEIYENVNVEKIFAEDSFEKADTENKRENSKTTKKDMRTNFTELRESEKLELEYGYIKEYIDEEEIQNKKDVDKKEEFIPFDIDAVFDAYGDNKNISDIEKKEICNQIINKINKMDLNVRSYDIKIKTQTIGEERVWKVTTGLVECEEENEYGVKEVKCKKWISAILLDNPKDNTTSYNNPQLDEAENNDVEENKKTDTERINYINEIIEIHKISQKYVDKFSEEKELGKTEFANYLPELKLKKKPPTKKDDDSNNSKENKIKRKVNEKAEQEGFSIKNKNIYEKAEKDKPNAEVDDAYKDNKKDYVNEIIEIHKISQKYVDKFSEEKELGKTEFVNYLPELKSDKKLMPKSDNEERMNKEKIRKEQNRQYNKYMLEKGLQKEIMKQNFEEELKKETSKENTIEKKIENEEQAAEFEFFKDEDFNK